MMIVLIRLAFLCKLTNDLATPTYTLFLRTRDPISILA